MGAITLVTDFGVKDPYVGHHEKGSSLRSTRAPPLLT